MMIGFQILHTDLSYLEKGYFCFWWMSKNIQDHQRHRPAPLDTARLHSTPPGTTQHKRTRHVLFSFQQEIGTDDLLKKALRRPETTRTKDKTEAPRQRPGGTVLERDACVLNNFNKTGCVMLT